MKNRRDTVFHRSTYKFLFIKPKISTTKTTKYAGYSARLLEWSRSSIISSKCNLWAYHDVAENLLLWN